MTGGLDAKSEVEASGRFQGGAPRDLAERLGAVDARLKLAALVAYVVAALHVRTPLALGVCAALALAFALATRLPARTVARTLRPLSAILGITVLMQVLYLQQGEALAWVGPIAVTREALVASGRMVAALVCIMVASVAFMRCTPPEQLLGVLRWALRPACALGWRSEALMLSLTVAFRFVPVLVGELSQLKRALESRGQSFDVGGVRARLRAYTLLFAPLVRNSFRRADMLAQAFVARCFASGPEPTSLQDAESHR